MINRSGRIKRSFRKSETRSPQGNDDDGLDFRPADGNALLQRPRALPRDRFLRHPVGAGVAVQRLEGRKHVVEDWLLYPRGSVEHRAAVIEGTRCREIPREPVHQQLREIPDRQHEARRHVRRERPDRCPRHHRAKSRGRIRVLRSATVAAPEARRHQLEGRSAQAQRLPVPDSGTDVAEDAREGDRREPAGHPLPALSRRAASTAPRSRSRASA